MSEYQYIAFRAIDKPVSDKNLTYMRKQSTRAEITPWSFENEYHFGDFHGDAVEMLRRGYDLHLHYANFGVRHLMIRLPTALPDRQVAAPYFDEKSLAFIEDKQGPGGILSIDPYYEPGDLEDLWDIDELLNRLTPLRAEITDGDVRPLYLAHLAVACDGNHDPEETQDAPVPAGLNKLSHAQRALMELYGLRESLVAAAARGAPPSSGQSDIRQQYAAWLERQPEATRNAWLAELLADPRTTVRTEMLAKFRKSTKTTAWPTIRMDRTIAELKLATEEIQQAANRKAAEKAAQNRAKQLAAMAADPTKAIRQTEKLVEQRSMDAYGQVATLLTDLRDAFAGTDQSHLAEEQASKLRNDHPTLKQLVAALRRKGFLKK
jgi:hypothetical protein